MASFIYNEPEGSFDFGKLSGIFNVSTNGDRVTYTDTNVYVGDKLVYEQDYPIIVDSHLLASFWTAVDFHF